MLKIRLLLVENIYARINPELPHGDMHPLQQQRRPAFLCRAFILSAGFVPTNMYQLAQLSTLL